MDRAAHEREGPPPHGMVSRRAAVGGVLAACVAAALLAGILGGLMRVGVAIPGAADAAWLGRGALAHAALMMGGFLGTVIGTFGGNFSISDIDRVGQGWATILTFQRLIRKVRDLEQQQEKRDLQTPRDKHYNPAPFPQKRFRLPQFLNHLRFLFGKCHGP